MFGGVVDTSVLIAFSGTGRLGVLLAVYPQLGVVPAVLTEIAVQGTGWRQAYAAQQEIRRGTHLVRVEVPEEAFHLAPGSTRGLGEREVVAVAVTQGIPALIDDRFARRMARDAGVIEVVGSLGVLAKAKSMGVVKAVEPIVTQFRKEGIRFGDDLVERFLREMGE